MALERLTLRECLAVLEPYDRFVAKGFIPHGVNTQKGQRSAAHAAATELGMTRWAMARRLSTALDYRFRLAAQKGEIGGPPIPPNAVPPIGFGITHNFGVYDGKGNLKLQSIKTRREPGEIFDPLPGHVVKGESALLDPDGRLLAKWVKTREGAGEGLVDALRETFAEYRGASGLIPAPTDIDDDLLTIYPLPDLHLGMYAWADEGGADYDVKIAVAQAMKSIDYLVQQSRPSRRAVVLGLGDYFHANDAKNVTPGSGHLLDVDGRWPKVFGAGARLATAIVNAVAQKHQDVEVVFLPGNHDPDAATSLTVALDLFYDGNPRIQVCKKPGVFWYRRHGLCLLGATHGHTMKPDRMAMAMAEDCAEDWGETASISRL